jgi:hypothetical protein
MWPARVMHNLLPGVLVRNLARAKLLRGKLLKVNSEPIAAVSIGVNSVAAIVTGASAGALGLSPV